MSSITGTKLFLSRKTISGMRKMYGGVYRRSFGNLLIQVGEISNIIAVVFSLIMFADWFVQYKFHYESNNIRRLITGLLCGYQFGNIIMKYLKYFM